MAKWNQSIKDDPMAHTIVVKSSKPKTTSDPFAKRKAQVVSPPVPRSLDLLSKRKP
jgi:hypothetical protein